MNKREFLTPADKDYWENFYEEGPGKKQYEWYSHVNTETIRTFLFGNQDDTKNLIKDNFQCLQTGVGNSLLFEELVQDPLFPQNVSIINIDISETAIEFMKSRKLEKTPTKIEYKVMDCTNLEFNNESFDFIIDKGCLDALLSHGGDEYGADPQVEKYIQEAYRVLKIGGVFMIISGNESFVTFPYLLNDQYSWEVETHTVKSNTKKLKNKVHNSYYYQSFYELVYLFEEMDINDYQLCFSELPDDIKLEIFKYVANVHDYYQLMRVCKEWNEMISEDSIWKQIFIQDFGTWTWTERSSNDRSTKYTKFQTNWREKYKDYFLRGFQWDFNKRHENIDLTNNDFTAQLIEGDGYHGVRAKQCFDKTHNYFEIIVEVDDDAEEERFDRGTEIFLSLGVANDNFDCFQCGSGWANHNSGIGFYNDGSLYAFGSQMSPKRRVKIRTGDRFGIQLNVSKDVKPYAMFYVNGDPISYEIYGVTSETLYPHIILAGNTKCKISIISSKLNRPPYILSEKQISYKNFLQGKELFDSKNYKDCIPLFTKSLEWKSTWRTGLKWRAKSYHRLELWNEAINDFTTLIELDPQNTNTWLARGVVYEALSKSDETYNQKALLDYTQAIELDTRNSTAYNNRAIIHENMKEFHLALDDYTKAIQYKPNCPIAYKNRADLYETLGEYDKALADYALAIEQDPTYTPAYNDRGCLRKKLGKFELALLDYNLAVQLTGKYYHYSNRAHVYEMLGKYDEALSDYSKAIELENNNRLAYNNRSSLWNLFENYEQAIDDSNKTISLGPAQANPYRAYILLKMNRLEEAFEDTEKCIRIHPDEIPDVYYVRGLILKKLFKFEESKQEMIKSLNIKFKVRVFTIQKIENALNDYN